MNFDATFGSLRTTRQSFVHNRGSGTPILEQPTGEEDDIIEQPTDDIQTYARGLSQNNTTNGGYQPNIANTSFIENLET